jgi:hypothetical protein
MNEPSFWKALPGAFAWPFGRPLRGALLAGFAFVLGSARWLPWTRVRPGRGTVLLLVLLAFLAACAVSYLFGIVRRTTHADDRPETLRNEVDPEDAWDDLRQFLGAFAVAYLPLLGFLAYALTHDGRPFRDREFCVAVGTTAVAGTSYFPMALLLLGFTGDWRAGFNLPLGLRGMRRLGAGYAGTVALFLAAAGLAALLEVAWVGRAPAFSRDGWIARVGATLVEAYLAMAAMRALGLLYVARGDRLGWVSRDA